MEIKIMMDMDMDIEITILNNKTVFLKLLLHLCLLECSCQTSSWPRRQGRER